MNQMQQSLNQVAQICNQLSQNEQSNVTKLQQMQEWERSAAQQLRQAAQLCQQVSSQMQQFMSSQQQFAGTGQYATSYSPTAGLSSTSNYQSTSWSNRPISTGFSGTQQSFGPQNMGQQNFSQQRTFGSEYQATGTAVYNTNNDLNR